MNFNYKLYRYWVRMTYSVEKDPIFILGNQKTGTSAIASLLGEATNTSYTIDVFCHLGNLQSKLFERELNFKQLISWSKDFFNKKIIKEPSFTFFYPELLELYPNSKFYLIIRDPFENIRSICNRLSIDGTDPNPKIDFNKFHDDWKYIMDGEFYGHKGETIIETLALRTQKCYDIYLENRDNIELIKYEDFKKNKKEFINNLAFKCNLQPKEDISHLLDKQFQPKGQAISPINFFSLENYNIIEHSCKKLIEDEYSK